jgi:hypothetical protein
MSRFYFHIRRGVQLVKDVEGVELSGLEAALEEATSAAREMVADMIRQGERIDGRSIEVIDEQGKLVLTVPLRSAMDII